MSEVFKDGKKVTRLDIESLGEDNDLLSFHFVYEGGSQEYTSYWKVDQT